MRNPWLFVRRSRLRAMSLVVLLALVSVSTLAAETFRFPSQNAVYDQLVPDVIPVQAGPTTLRISSPSQSLTLEEHQLELEPHPDGGHSANLEVTFLGGGDLIVDADVGGIVSRMEDEVVVPRQTLRLHGRIDIEAAEVGYRITIRELPKTITVAFESRLAGDLVSSCEQIPLFGMMGIECAGLSKMLSSAAVPLPEAGREFYLRSEELSASEREQLNRYLAQTR